MGLMSDIHLAGVVIWLIMLLAHVDLLWFTIIKQVDEENYKKSHNKLVDTKNTEIQNRELEIEDLKESLVQR